MSTQTEEMKDQQYQDGTHEANPPADPAKKRRTMFGIALIALVVIVGCVGWFLYSGTYESTDDAQLDAHLNPVSSVVLPLPVPPLISIVFPASI